MVLLQEKGQESIIYLSSKRQRPPTNRALIDPSHTREVRIMLCTKARNIRREAFFFWNNFAHGAASAKYRLLSFPRGRVSSGHLSIS